MTKEELAEHIKNRVVLIGTNLKHLESIQKYSKNNKTFSNAFDTIYISLLNSTFIELFKLFDFSKNNAREHSIYGLIDMIEDEKQTYYKKISKYQSDINSIRNRRNKLVAHDTGVNVWELFKNNKIESLQELLQCVADICCEVNDKLYPNTYVSNANFFDDWCYMATTSIDEVCMINEKLIEKMVSKELFNETFDSFIDELKQKN